MKKQLLCFIKIFKPLKTNKIALLGATILSILIIIAFMAPFISPYSPIEVHLDQRLQNISMQHICGTDELGRDIFSRLIYGTRITFFIILLISLLSAPIGLLLGIIAGYFGNKIDNLIMRVTDVFLAFPSLILAMALVSALGPGLKNAIIAISLIAWAPYARLVRAQTLKIKNLDYINVIKLQGASHFRILFKHIMPSCFPFLIVRVNLDMAGFILTAAGLGFLGLGAQPPTPEWGAMIAGSRKFLLTHWWIATFPGFVIFLVSLGFNLLGEGLRDIFDPKNEQKIL